MKVKSQAKWIRISAKKVRRVMNLIRGKKALEALTLLSFMRDKGAKVVAEVLKSAIANAKHDYKLKEDDLYLSEVYADDASMLKRWQPRARGRAFPIKKRLSHVTVFVSPKGEPAIGGRKEK